MHNRLLVPMTIVVMSSAVLFSNCSEKTTVVESGTSVPSFQLPRWELTSGTANERFWVISTSREGRIYAGTSFSTVYVSSNNGDSWTVVSLPTNAAFVRSIIETDTGTVFAGSDLSGIFRSTDGGMSWARTNSGLEDTSVFALVENGGALFAGTRKSLYKSSDFGDHWFKVLDSVFVLSLISDQRGHLFAGINNQGVLRSTDDGITWTIVNSGVATPNQFHADSVGTIWLANYNGVERSTDAGITWSRMGPITVQGFCITTNSQGHIFLGGSWSMFYSFDGGHTWTVTDKDSFNVVGTWDIARASDDRVIAATSNGIYRTRSE